MYASYFVLFVQFFFAKYGDDKRPERSGNAKKAAAATSAAKID